MTTERLEARMDGLDGRMGRLDGRMGRLEERIGRVEAVLPHLATKADIAEVKTLISDREAIMLKWLIGITTTTAVSLLMVLVSLFMVFIQVFT